MLGRGLAVDLFDQPAAPPLRRALRNGAELTREGAANLRALRLIVRQGDDQLAVAAADPRREPAIDDHHARPGRASGLSRARRGRLFATLAGSKGPRN